MVDVDATFVSSLAASPTLTAGTGRIVSASFSSALSGAVSLSSVRTRSVNASFSSSLNASFDLGGTGIIDRQLSAAFISSLNGSVNLTGASDTYGMSVANVVSDILNLWGFVCWKIAPKFALDRAISDLNSALQTVWNKAEERDYWTSQTIEITLADGEDSYDLDTDVQNVTGSCRVSSDKRPLALTGTLTELENFAALFLDSVASSQPIAYHIDRYKQAGNDPAKCVLRVSPPVGGASIDLLLDVVREAPRYTEADMYSGTIVPIPHRYVESLLLPVARYRATSFYLFTDNGQMDNLQTQYKIAADALGLADPLPGKAADEAQ